MKSKRSIVAAVTATIAAVMAGGLASWTPAAAQVPPTTINVHITVLAPDAGAVFDALKIEVHNPSAVPTLVDGACVDPTSTGANELAAAGDTTCQVDEYLTYAMGVDGAPAGATVSAFCNVVPLQEQQAPLELIPGPDAQFVVDATTDYVDCYVGVIQPAVLIDKITDDNGPAAPSDFTLEVYDDTGASVATAVDDSDALCGPGLPIDNCAVVPLAAGDYQLGEAAVRGYAPAAVSCEGFLPDDPTGGRDAFPSGVGEFSLADAPNENAYPFVQCRITNDYYEGGLVVTKTVVNDSGGTATADQFTAEVYTEPEGSLVTSVACLADGSCIDATLPIGDYRIGESGAGGYTASVACTETTPSSSLPPIDTTPPNPPAEAIAGDAAVATVGWNGQTTCVITNNDPTTTTTSTTTTVAMTTTTEAPTTTVPAILPPTGPNDTNRTIAIIAFVLVVAGGALLALRRRPA